ncbi:hypothetical protein B1H58_04380 [Pantoea alhagi]|uniref:Uncharacterized protein n=1 Tax=Pantoea alhagi TaxID=1891675 RepID=A0A1W6B2L9_9GAMM|nr:hypothetical protein [Pantoea alhagi]ARJ41319.1 hypothetical protein B1H58_04380 [Pantoea alhagi]URQ61355.1 hypothetical protein LQ939_03060 [Pantoea alhagi]
MSITTGLSNMITGGASSMSQISGALGGADFMMEMQGVKNEMQQNQVAKAKMDAEFQRINGIADSQAQAGSAAAQVKISY